LNYDDALRCAHCSESSVSSLTRWSLLLLLLLLWAATVTMISLHVWVGDKFHYDVLSV